MQRRGGLLGKPVHKTAGVAGHNQVQCHLPYPKLPAFRVLQEALCEDG